MSVNNKFGNYGDRIYQFQFEINYTCLGYPV